MDQFSESDLMYPLHLDLKQYPSHIDYKAFIYAGHQPNGTHLYYYPRTWDDDMECIARPKYVPVYGPLTRTWLYFKTNNWPIRVQED